MKDDNTRNTIIFIVLAGIILLAWQFLYTVPQAKRQEADAARQASAVAPIAPNAATAAAQPLTRQQAVAASPRVPIVTPALKGSLNLRGARIDDLYLTQYRETLSKTSPPVELLRPEGAENAWLAEVGWVGANVPGLPTKQTDWTLVKGSTLAPGQPVVLSYTNGAGLTFTRTISVDDKYMFTVTDTVANTGAGSITLAPYGSVQRQGLPPGLGKSSIVHEGGMGWLDGNRQPVKYKDWEKKGTRPALTSTGGWIGITDRYWLAGLIPAQNEQMTGQYRLTKTAGPEIYDANFVGAARAIPAGRQISYTTHVFAGAKKVGVLESYQKLLGAQHLDEAVDWGRLWFLTRPLSTFLSWLYLKVGNFGVAIMILTVVVRGLFFPLANKSYESMTKMRKVQPAMEALRAKYKDDPAKQQQEIMALYQREKVNPLAGCLPMLMQIPVFFALFKVLQISLDMRHAPFFGFIRDLSAPDPTTIFNLFGALPYDPASLPVIGSIMATTLHIGILPILYGLTTWLTTSMSPPAPDPAQQRIFQLMPILFTFIMAQFAIGLLVYYTWSNLFTVAQQYVIMRRFGVDNPIDRIVGRLSGKPKAAG